MGVDVPADAEAREENGRWQFGFMHRVYGAWRTLAEGEIVPHRAHTRTEGRGKNKRRLVWVDAHDEWEPVEGLPDLGLPIWCQPVADADLFHAAHQSGKLPRQALDFGNGCYGRRSDAMAEAAMPAEAALDRAADSKHWDITRPWGWAPGRESQMRWHLTEAANWEWWDRKDGRLERLVGDDSDLVREHPAEPGAAVVQLPRRRGTIGLRRAA